jgi:hypothetical protein
VWDVSDRSCFQALGGQVQALGSRVRALDEFCSTDLRVVRDRPATQGHDLHPYLHHLPALHPFLRRVLLHALAGRDENEPDCWWAVHARLRNHYQNNARDDTRAMYHTLALGELAPAGAYLDRRFQEISAEHWLREELYIIVKAPQLPLSPDAANPEQVVARVASATTDNRRVPARLVSALWMSADPLSDPDRRLDLDMANELGRLVDHADGDDRFVLLKEANRYQMRGQQGY